jgi:RHS repeat-associated protein
MYSLAGQLVHEERRGKGASEYIHVGGRLLATRSPTGVTWTHVDALGSPVAVTDNTGSVVERRRFEPYGAELGGQVKDRPGYTGHVSDSATGLSYMQQRYMDALLGVFLSVDPVTAYEQPVGQFNRYRYASGNPYKFTDPDGRMSRKDIEAANQSFLLEKSKRPVDRLVDMVASTIQDARGDIKEISSAAHSGSGEVPIAAVISIASMATPVGPEIRPAVAEVRSLIATHGRTMSNKALDRLVKSIRSDGAVRESLVVTRHEGALYILDGHHRALAAPRAGVSEVPVREVQLPWGAYKSPADLVYSAGPGY